MNEEVDLKTLRKEHGLTLAMLSSKVGLSISALSKLETGNISITPNSASLLSRFYEVKIKPKKAVLKYVEYDMLDKADYKRQNKRLSKENRELKALLNRLNNGISKMFNIITEIKEA